MASNWGTSSRSNSEEEVPLPPLTKCTAIKDFPGEEPQDLPFRCGEVLTIIEPCSVVYWYTAQNSRGRRGTIPITYVKVHDLSSKEERPPPPPPTDTPLPIPSAFSTTIPGPPLLPSNDTTPPPLPPMKPLQPASMNASTPPPLPPMNSSTPPPLPPMNSSTPPPLPPMNSSTPPPLPPTNSSTSPPILPPKNFSPQLPHKISPVLPLPPKPLPSSTKVPAAATKTYLLFPKFDSPSESVVRRKPVSRVHSNEFRGAQSSHHGRNALIPGKRTQRHSQPIVQPPLFESRAAAPISRPSPPSLHSPDCSDVPPPLPSPRMKPKAVPPPVIPGSIIHKSNTAPSPLTHGTVKIQSRQLPSLPSSQSDPQLDIDKRPPAPLPGDTPSKGVSRSDSIKSIQRTTAKYTNQKEFSQCSGWFSPSLESVLCKMMYSSHLSTLTSVTTGVYIFTHKYHTTKRYVGKSRTCYHDLVQMFHRLYEKKEEKLNMLEKELKYNSPDADQWSFRIYSVNNPDQVEPEANKRILLHNTLHPSGLNAFVRFTSRESFDLFAEMYAKVMREKATKFVNPIRAAQKQSD